LNGRAPADVLEETGWARSVGGAGPYLTLFARAGSRRADVDTAVAETSIHELPSARGCTYVVPAADYALALRAGQGFGDEMKTAAKLGVTAAEIDKLCAAVLDAVSKSPLDPDELREAAAGAIRKLGPEGKKKGLASTLPVALEKLQAEGEIRRIPTNGRLDQQRYRYARWERNPLTNFRLSTEETYSELARRFFHWIGPATLSEFQWFSGLGVKAARAAAEPLGLVPVEGRLILPELRDEFERFQPPPEPQYVLGGSLDGIAHLRRDVKSLLAPEDLEGKGPLTDLPNHAILDRGRLAGLWEYDTTTGSIAWMGFVPRSSALEAAVARMEEFVRNDLGDARSFSLDSPKSRAPRIEALRRTAAGA
jgi:hypothetical protein